jgi:hypothetical protein
MFGFNNSSKTIRDNNFQYKIQSAEKRLTADIEATRRELKATTTLITPAPQKPAAVSKPAVKPASRADYELAEDMGEGHMSDTGFVSYSKLHPTPDVQAKIDAYQARMAAKNAATKRTGWLEDQY